MDIDTLLAEHDPARRRPFPGPDSAESIALYRKIVQPGSVTGPAGGAHRRIVIGTMTGAAAASAIGLTLGLLPSGAQTAGPRPSSSRHADSGSTAINTHLTAKQVLDKAAATALTEPSVTPRSDQFVYTKEQDGGGHVALTWASVDGSRNGLIKGYFEGANGTTTLLGCVDGEHQIRLPGYNGKPYHGDGKPSKKPIPLDGPVVTEPCTPQPAFFPDMPTAANAMPAFLVQSVGARLSDADNVAAHIEDIFDGDYLLPAQRAALYQFLATLPGLTVEHNANDISGRPGIGVGWSHLGAQNLLIFDPTTYTLLGGTTVGLQGQVGGYALITQPTIVDQVGQVP